jgi:hypothetical protein
MFKDSILPKEGRGFGKSSIWIRLQEQDVPTVSATIQWRHPLDKSSVSVLKICNDGIWSTLDVLGDIMSLTKDFVNKACMILVEDVPRRDPVQIMKSCTDSGTSRTKLDFSCMFYLNLNMNYLYETSTYDEGGEVRLLMTSSRAHGRSEASK